MQYDFTRYGRDSDLPFGQHWKKHALKIANEQGWCCYGECGDSLNCWKNCLCGQKRLKFQGTLRTYDRYNCCVAEKLGNKPISEISLVDVCQAIGAVSKEKNYMASTTAEIATAVRWVFVYASLYGDADNIMDYRRGRSDDVLDFLAVLGSDRPEDYIREKLREESERLASITRSLTIRQQERLASYIWNHIEEDGRCCLLALMLYAGTRPAEGRGLRWKDRVSFVDHKDRSLINNYHIRDGQGNLYVRQKSDNGYRRIPEHIELQAILDKRRAHIKKEVDGPIDDFPICCFKNEYDRPCRDYEAAALAKEIFKKELKLTEEELYVYQIQHLIEQYDKNNVEKELEQHLTLYVLRRNFWTWLQACTRLNDTQKRLIMGHELDNREERREKNDENLLWEICRKMDQCVISRMLHEKFLFLPVDRQEKVGIIDQGICFIHISKEILAAGAGLSISVTAEEAGEGIRLKSLSPLRWIGGIPLKVQVSEMPPRGGDYGINCQFENWQAHTRVPLLRGSKNDKGMEIKPDGKEILR